jgi:endonuclease-8
VDGLLLESVEATGKNILLRFEGGVVVRSHLRMSGRWRVQPRGGRVAGRPWLVLRGGAWEAVQSNGPVLEVLRGVPRRRGLDILGEAVGAGQLVATLRRVDGRRLLGEALLDQRFVSGIGNMWAAEALWHARLSPWLPLEQAADDELAWLLRWVRSAMQASVAGGRPSRSVYRRVGRPCRRCGELIASRGIGDANRTAYWCPSCQRSPAAGPQPA